jgi:hypothetical protein
MKELVKKGQMRGSKAPKTEESPCWGNMEKETLKKYLLIFGYGRWKKIRKTSAG